jgi:hypothetical protein
MKVQKEAEAGSGLVCGKTNSDQTTKKKQKTLKRKAP